MSPAGLKSDNQLDQKSMPDAAGTSWRPALLFLGGGFFLLLLSLGLLAMLDSQLAWSAEIRLALLFLLSLLVLGFSVGGLGYVLRRVLRGGHLNPVVITLALAYGLPALVYLLLSGVLYRQFQPISTALQALSFFPGFFPGQPWMYLLPVLILAFLGNPAVLPQPAEPVWRLPSLGFSLLIGALLGLAAAFAYSLLAGMVESSSAAQALARSDELPLLVRLMTLLVSLAVAPWALERFFRGELLARWQPVIGRSAAVLATAALYASLQFRPLVWLPAFLVGLGLAGLVLRTGRLRDAVVAHAAVNLVLFFLGWYLVI